MAAPDCRPSAIFAGSRPRWIDLIQASDDIKRFQAMPKKGTAHSVDLKVGDFCQVIGRTHKGKSGTARDLNTSKTGHLTITVVEPSGERFKTLARNVVVVHGDAT